MAIGHYNVRFISRVAVGAPGMSVKLDTVWCVAVGSHAPTASRGSRGARGPAPSCVDARNSRPFRRAEPHRTVLNFQYQNSNHET
jgi:hypothetical protein